ncbi:efflux RND transporter periplasmic adaptor subunit [Tunicatimonas pelagia]|uniref:efflux RND transporter periplasmic adaptor subunit n=1 Tax=Tunicatimonas pelagia TaxID=931531 RepID=UPI0026656F28|nr:efflux RND transporter periplasmic adaptor subunit [Tunicatimonas pelagia]WKN45405.1 efflux RND transporter periplasmic adaptor subunit [Tunicatimonas pelagia]
MNKHRIFVAILGLIGLLFVGCDSESAEHQEGQGLHSETKETEHDEGEISRVVHLSDRKFRSLAIKIDTIPIRPLTGVVKANGRLEVPPQHEATVTAILGANISSIRVIEGDKVSKGQVLAYIAHPDLVQLQTNYLKAYRQAQFLEKEYQRQKRLYEAEVGAGKTFQQTEADYLSIRDEVKGYEAQLRQLSLNVRKIQNGDIYDYVPVVSSIKGYVEKVKVQVGQYVDPQTEMFAIVNTEHVHADLMVFEEDVYKVKEGQQVFFTVASVPGNTLRAEIYSVGKQFEQNPRAVHVHAEIKQKEDYLIPGMYIMGKIHTESKAVLALPQEAIVEEAGNPYLFLAKAHQEDGQTEWEFTPVEIRTGTVDEDWVEVNLLEPLPSGAQVAWNNAYYLVAEMNKGETSHGH